MKTNFQLIFCLTLGIVFSQLAYANTYTFTNAGVTGRDGPTQAQIDTNYTGTNLENNVTINTRGIQEWTVPADGNYSIEVMGAQGGRGGTDSPVVEGGLGAKIKGVFNLSQNEVLKIMVGQKGLGGGDAVGGGGGGGSFVVRGSTPLIVAGGGGGGSYQPTFEGGIDSRVGGDGRADLSTSTAAGTTSNASGGAGFLSNSTAGSSSGSAKSFTNGGTGATGKTNHDGGFGGGGGGSTSYPAGGGGGGYQGGNASGTSWTPSIAQSKGGYSYNSGTDQNNTTGANEGHGLVVITVLSSSGNLSQAPVITQGNSAISKSLNEDTSASWTASELNATDSDTNASSLSWSLLSSPTHGSANVDGNGSAPTTLSYQPNNNYNGSDSFTIRVTDGENNDSITINLTINPVNDPPSLSGATNATLAEDTTATGDLNTTDPDGMADGSYYIISSAPSNGSASIGPADGNWTYLPNVNFFGSDSFSISITDDLNNSVNQSISLTINSVNDAPTELNATTLLQISENQSIGTTIGQLTATDPDANTTLTFTLVASANDNQNFTIETNGTLKTATVFDFESNSSYTINAKVRDQYNLNINQTFTVQISNIIEDNDGDGIEDAQDPDDDNDGFPDSVENAYGSDPLDGNSTANAAPTKLVSDSNLSITENNPLGSIVGTLSAYDSDSNSTLTFTLVDGNGSNSNNLFSLEFNGTVKTASVFDYESNGSNLSIRARVSDQYNESIEKAFLVTVLNDPTDDPLPPSDINQTENNQTTPPIFDHNQTDQNTTQPPVLDQNITDSNSTPVLVIDQNATPTSENNQTIVVQPKPVTPSQPDANQTKTYWWTPLPETAEGWRTSDWFGSFRPFTNSWLYHAELGWMHATQGETGDLWLWNQEFGWLWTANGVFPHLFNHSTANWIYFLKKQDGKARYYDYSTESVK